MISTSRYCAGIPGIWGCYCCCCCNLQPEVVEMNSLTTGPQKTILNCLGERTLPREFLQPQEDKKKCHIQLHMLEWNLLLRPPWGYNNFCFIPAVAVRQRWMVWRNNYTKVSFFVTLFMCIFIGGNKNSKTKTVSFIDLYFFNCFLCGCGLIHVKNWKMKLFSDSTSQTAHCIKKSLEFRQNGWRNADINMEIM